MKQDIARRVSTGEIVDDRAIRIGEEYSAGQAAMRDGLRESLMRFRSVGCMLTEVKATLVHGAWLPWLKANAGVLGFEGPRTAQMLLAFASNTKLTSHLDTCDCAELLEISRKLWGNKGGPVHRISYAGKDDWGTPAEFIELARRVMGDIDLDPATHSGAQAIVGATKFFTIEDNSLSLEWHGRVWLNPPYSQPLIGQFIEKLLTELECGNASEAILLVNNSSDTAWFQRAAGASSSICFTKGRISFLGPDGPGLSPVQGQAFMYFGENYQRFESVFSKVGFTCCVTQSNSNEVEPESGE